MKVTLFGFCWFEGRRISPLVGPEELINRSISKVVITSGE
jgi:hypothetical protein